MPQDITPAGITLNLHYAKYDVMQEDEGWWHTFVESFGHVYNLICMGLEDKTLEAPEWLELAGIIRAIATIDSPLQVQAANNQELCLSAVKTCFHILEIEEVVPESWINGNHFKVALAEYMKEPA